MIELPEARTLAKQLRNEVMGKVIACVGGNYTDHKFTFYYKDPNDYSTLLVGKKVTNVVTRNFYVELELEDVTLLMRDGANIRYYDNRQAFPEKSKLLLVFQDGTFLNVTTSMYAGIAVFKQKDGYPNPYYELEKSRVGALDPEFTYSYFCSLLEEQTLKLSAKAFLATEQRILGIGNGVVQDILWNASIHPKRKMNTLTDQELESLYQAIVTTLKMMTEQGGRNTEKNLYGESGGYSTILSNKTYQKGCPKCYGEIKKETYLGGSIYYCPNCQEKETKN